MEYINTLFPDEDRYLQAFDKYKVISQAFPLAAQEQTSQVTRVTLGLDKASPGDPVFIPVVLGSAAGIPIGKLILEIRFPSPDLSFVEMRYATSEEEAGYNLTMEIESRELAPSVLKMTIESQGEKELAGGVLAFLTFQLSQDAPKGEILQLESQAQGFAPGEPSAAVDVVASDGQIEVVEVPSLFACFFYMH